MRGNVRFIVQVTQRDNNAKRRYAEKAGTLVFDSIGDAQMIARQINRNDNGIEARTTIRLHAYGTIIDTTPHDWEMLQSEINLAFSDLRETIYSSKNGLVLSDYNEIEETEMK